VKLLPFPDPEELENLLSELKIDSE